MSLCTGAYIQAVELEEYLCFKGTTEISFVDKNGDIYLWTVFLGNNNSGKTNLLKAIAGSEPYRIKRIEDGIEREYFAASAYVIYNRIFPARGSTQIARVTTTYTFLDKTRWRNGTTYRFQYNKGGTSNPDDERFAKIKFYSYGVSRRLSKNEKDVPPITDSVSLFNPEEELVDMESWLFQLKFAANNGQPNGERRLELINKLIVGEIFPEIKDIRFISDEYFKNYIEYNVGNNWYLLSELGYGYQTTIAWIVDFAKKMFERYPESENPLAEPAIVLIDEIDLHLHPNWQRSIVNYLSRTFEKTQFIVTTHSPMILQTLEKVNLYKLRKQPDGVNVEPIPIESFNGWSIDEIMAEVMDLEEGLLSAKHSALLKQFSESLNEEDYPAAKQAYNGLMQILHPDSVQRKLLELQLSSIEPVND